VQAVRPIRGRIWRFVAPVLFLFLFVGAQASAFVSAARGLPVLRHARDVRNLSPAEASRAYPVEVRAVVTFVDPHESELFIQDETAGIFVFERASVSDQPLRVGQLVALTGVSTPADFAPAITKARIHVLGTAPPASA